MRKALVVGIDYYAHLGRLEGCVNGAHIVRSSIELHGDGTFNFGVELLTGGSKDEPVTRKELRSRVQELFQGKNEIALFYFAGRGHLDDAGAYLVTSDADDGAAGIPLADILKLANASEARNKIIILDCDHSGEAGNFDVGGQAVGVLAEGMTILTASERDQYAVNGSGAGVFTTLLADALEGPAANLVGAITPGSIYAHIDQSLGAWAQRPLFKTNVRHFVSLRTVPPPIAIEDLRRIAEFFPEPGFHLELDPTFEPERPDVEAQNVRPPDAENTRTFAILQRYNRLNLLVPVNAPHMWHAAMHSKQCKLTALGEHYRKLVTGNVL